MPTTKPSSSVAPDSASATSSMTQKQLIEYLPDSPGYIRVDKPSGEDSHLGKSGNKYYAFAKQEYEKDGRQYYIEIVDYNDDTAHFHGLIRMYGYDGLINNPEYQQTVVAIGSSHVKGILARYRNDPQQKLTVALANRFIINGVVLDSSSEASLEPLISSIDFTKLSAAR